MNHTEFKDEAALRAMQALLAADPTFSTSTQHRGVLARMAHDIAEAMAAERIKRMKEQG